MAARNIDEQRTDLWARPGPGNQEFMTQSAMSGPGASRGTRFAVTKFRPPALPATLISKVGAA